MWTSLCKGLERSSSGRCGGSSARSRLLPHSIMSLWASDNSARPAPRPSRRPYNPIETNMAFSPIPEILEELKAGKPIVLVDDEDRENEGDLVYAAEKINPAAMNFVLAYGRGTVCLS